MKKPLDQLQDDLELIRRRRYELDSTLVYIKDLLKQWDGDCLYEESRFRRDISDSLPSFDLHVKFTGDPPEARYGNKYRSCYHPLFEGSGVYSLSTDSLINITETGGVLRMEYVNTYHYSGEDIAEYTSTELILNFNLRRVLEYIKKERENEGSDK